MAVVIDDRRYIHESRVQFYIKCTYMTDLSRHAKRLFIRHPVKARHYFDINTAVVHIQSVK